MKAMHPSFAYNLIYSTHKSGQKAQLTLQAIAANGKWNKVQWRIDLTHLLQQTKVNPSGFLSVFPDGQFRNVGKVIFYSSLH